MRGWCGVGVVRLMCIGVQRSSMEYMAARNLLRPRSLGSLPLMVLTRDPEKVRYSDRAGREHVLAVGRGTACAEARPAACRWLCCRLQEAGVAVIVCACMAGTRGGRVKIHDNGKTERRVENTSKTPCSGR